MPPQGQPPGSSPATMPVANRGHAAAGLARLSQIVRLLEETIPLLGTGSEAGRDVLKTLQTLSKHVPPGAMSQGVEQNALQGLLMKQRQMAPQIAAMRASQGQPGPMAQAPPAA